MTLIELLSVVAFLALGLLGAAIGRALGGMPGALGGLVLGWLSLPGIAIVAMLVERRFLLGPPRGPRCVCGRDELCDEWDPSGRLFSHCNCGEIYRREGGRVFRRTPAGALRPYLRWHWRRGWCAQGLHAPRADAPYRD